MPCYDHRDSEHLRDLKKDLDKVTRLLCEVCTENPPDPKSELGTWWAKHQEADRLRKEAEELFRKEQERRQRILDENKELEERRKLTELIKKFGPKGGL